MLGQVCLQEAANPFKFLAGLMEKLGGVGEMPLEALAFEFTQQRHQPPHTAGGAGAGATVGQPSHFLDLPGLNGGSELFLLFFGLAQVKSYQLAQVVRVPVGEIEQP